MKMLAAMTAILMLVCAGCNSTYCRTGDPGCFPSDTVSLPRQNFDAVTPGMTRAEVVKILGSPTDETLTFMHWETGPRADVWVVFDDTGTRVETKYWQDDETLRMQDVPAVR